MMKRWLLRAAFLMVGACDSCPVHLTRTVTLQAAQAAEAQTDDAGARDGGLTLAGVSTVTASNCADVCAAVPGVGSPVSCTPTTDDAGMPAASCQELAHCD